MVKKEKMKKICYSALLCLTWIAAVFGTGSQMSRFTAPLISKAPVIDGVISPDEWKDSLSFDGMAWKGELEERMVQSYIAADADNFYFAIVSELPPDGTLLQEIQKNSPAVVHDDAAEVFINPFPGMEKGITFQFIFNSADAHAYQSSVWGGYPAPAEWNGQYIFKNRVTDKQWITEIKVPVANTIKGRQVTDGAWGISLCRDWKRPWVFSCAPTDFTAKKCSFTFKQGAPAIHFIHTGSFSDKNIKGELSLYNTGTAPLNLSVKMNTDLDMMPSVTVTENIPIPGGQTRTIPYDASTHAANCGKFNFSVDVANGDSPCYSVRHHWGEKRKARWEIVSAKALPFDFEYAFYPYKNKLRIKNLFQNYNKPLPESVTYIVQKKSAAQPLREIRSLSTDKHEEFVTLPDIEGTYTITLNLNGETLSKEFIRQRYPWERNPLGKSRKVYPPFTPMTLKGRTISTVLRDHQIAKSGLPEQITVQGVDILAAPVSLLVNGSAVPANAIEYPEIAADVIRTSSRFSTDSFTAEAKGRWEYDGCLKYDLTIDPQKCSGLHSLILEVPLKAQFANMFHAMGDGIRNTLYDYLPEGEGVIWDATKVQGGYMPEKFCTYLYLGSPLRGLSFFCENDKGWSWDRSTPNMTVSRTDGIIYLRVNLINKAVTASSPCTISFGLLAAPVKPRIAEWRTLWLDEKFTLLGTCINWLGGPGSCGNVYPPGKDLYFWEMIARGNVEKVPREDAAECITRGEKYYAPFSDFDDMKTTWKNHVYHNVCGSRYQKSMVFYYNRAVFNALEEYATFSGEWGLQEFQDRDFIPSRDEIKVVPSDSYIDFALYWYQKSFIHGRNKGIYWDNWFIRPSFNTEMTDAYFNPESGSITPAAGIWALRELSKRSFQMMCEEGMPPITFPHMTSTSILPMLSFATVQYDWEWKYSTGDVQNRFSRPYTMLVSNGELAGVLPVMLGEHGPQSKDEWTQRTYAGVCLTHELIAEGQGAVWKTLRDPLLKEYQHNPELKVTRYWDETSDLVKFANKDNAWILYSIPGEKSLLIVCSYSDSDNTSKLTLNLKSAGLPDGVMCRNYETKEPVAHQSGTLSLALKSHELIAIEFFIAETER